MVIGFDEMIRKSKTIVMGTYLGFNGKTAYESNQYYFAVYQTLKGTNQADTLVLNRAGSGSVEIPVGTYCVAFINEKDEFEWVGTTKKINKTLDNTILFLEGFYDWNAYIVGPASISIGQLKDYLSAEIYTGTAKGNLYFFSNTSKKMEPSSIELEINYTYQDQSHNRALMNPLSYSVKINGIDLKDFKKAPVFNLPFWDDILTVEYQPNLYRPLEIEGKILDNSTTPNVYNIMFWVTEPEELTYEEFVQFIDHPEQGQVYFECEVKLENDLKYTLLINDELGHIGKLLNYNGKDLPISFFSTSPKREVGFSNYPNDLRLEFDSCLVNKEVFELAGNEMVRELKMGTVKATIYSKIGNIENPITRCTVSYKATKFAKNPNYK